MTAKACEIIEKNMSTVEEFFAGLASGEYYDGTSWQLYLYRDDDFLTIHREASDQSWLQREDGSLLLVLKVSGYDDRPLEERYNAEEHHLADFGLADWLDYTLVPALDEALEGER